MSLSRSGRILFAVAIACFGAHYLAFAAGITTAAPGPPWFPAHQWISWASGVCLLVAGVSLAMNWKARAAGMMLGIALLLRVAIVHLPKFFANLHDPGPWTSGGEILALSGGAFIVADAASGIIQHAARTFDPTTRLGHYFASTLLLIVGVQHLIYGRFIATLIPSWIPGHVFFAYFVGIAFFAAALAILTERSATLASTLLGLTFLVWVLILHAPRVAAAPHNGSEWTSAIMALAMSGTAFAVAGSFAQRE